MREFKIDVPQSQLDDLKQRLAATRWPDEMPGVGWSRGAPLSYIRELAEYWRTSFDWRAAEARMNQFPHFLTEVDGVQVHFLHARSTEPNAMPLIITHGWPGSFVEFLDVIDPLINPTAHGGDPADAFHVIIPSMPGYGFSGPTHQLGWDTERVALAWTELMRRLGYTRYIAQGGDWGSPISLRVGLADPEHVAGVHINMCVTLPPPDPAVMAQLISQLSESDMERLQFGGYFFQDGFGWMKIQATRPQTLAYSLTDSPVGQLAWIAEKFKERTDSEKTPESAVNRDRLLNLVSIYWLTATAGTSGTLYYEDAPALKAMLSGALPPPVQIPAGVAVFPADIFLPLRRLAERDLANIVHWSEFDRGGHFAAMEEPDLLVADLRAFSQKLRER